MGSSVEGEMPQKKTRREIFYGDREMSDIVLSAGDRDFHVHRSFLAIRSTYFKDLFAVHPPLEEGKTFIKIDDDEGDFRVMLSMLYNQTYWEKDEAPICPYAPLFSLEGRDAKSRITEKWEWLYDDMRLAKKYKVVELVRPILERHLLLTSCGQSNCLYCASRSLIALFFDWKHIIMRMVSSVDALVTVLTVISPTICKDPGSFRISPWALSHLLDKIIGGTPKRFELAIKDPAGDSKTKDEAFHFEQKNALSSDVTLVVRNKEFHVHKHFLAARSSFFTAMFFSEFKEKHEKRISIEADEIAFKAAMELLYRNRIDDATDFLHCKPAVTEESLYHIYRFWKRFPSIMQLFDQFDLPLGLIEDLLRGSWCGDVRCIECASKKLFAMHYDLKTVKDKIPSDPAAIALCLRCFQDILPVPLKLAPTELGYLIKATKEKFPKKS